MIQVTVIGLGYVGLPLAKLIHENEMPVFGVDINPKAVDVAKENNIPSDTIFTDNSSTSNIFIVCVPTPVDEKHLPDLKPLKSALSDLCPHLKDDDLVIIESTIYPGVTEEVIKPILDKSKVNYHLTHCPERIDPGSLNWNVGNIPRVVGGIDKTSTVLACDFYKSIVDAEIMALSNVRSAEATKIMENSFRDINIAFVNEMAKSFDNMGIDVVEVIKAASTKPFGFIPHYPGCGVGGHCIPVDPYYLIEKARQEGFNHQFLSLARAINNSMPEYTVEKLIDVLSQQGLTPSDVSICVLGLAYKKDVDDMRESPAVEIIELLNQRGFNPKVFDPFIPDSSSLENLDECLKNDCIVIATDHSEFKKIEDMTLENVKIIVDARNILDKEKIVSKKINYTGIGR